MHDAWLRPSDQFAFLDRNGLRFRLPGPTQHVSLLRPELRAVAQRIQQIRWPLARAGPASDLDKRDSGPKALYSQDGTFLGESTSLDLDLHVITQNVTSEALAKGTEWEILDAVFETINITDTHGTTFREFLDRAHWAYGECTGAPGIVDHYAYAIHNIMNDKKAREVLYNRHKRLGFFEVSHGPNHYYKSFAKLRKNPKELDKLHNARHTIAATIGAILGRTVNPVGTAILWKGGKTASIFHRRHLRHQKDPRFMDVTFVETGKDKKFKHFFYNLTELGKKESREARERRRESAEVESDDGT